MRVVLQKLRSGRLDNAGVALAEWTIPRATIVLRMGRWQLRRFDFANTNVERDTVFEAIFAPRMADQLMPVNDAVA
jgi:hypothetical protein